MPFTASHVIAAVPLRRLLARRAVTSALVIGTMVPDFRHFIPVIPGHAHLPTHFVSALLWFALPVGLVTYFVFERLLRAPAVALLPVFVRQRLGARLAPPTPAEEPPPVIQPPRQPEPEPAAPPAPAAVGPAEAAPPEAEAPKPAPVSDAAAIRALLDRWSAAIRSGDVDAAARCYAPSLSYLGRPGATQDDVRGHMKYLQGRTGKLAIHRIGEVGFDSTSGLPEGRRDRAKVDRRSGRRLNFIVIGGRQSVG